jgi:hypothetical protein
VLLSDHACGRRCGFCSAPVRTSRRQNRADQAAGDAEIAGHGGYCIGPEIDGRSGHVFAKGWDAKEIGEELFAAAGISFP